jgi:hypothetical protein
MTKYASLAAVTLAATASLVAPTASQAQTATGPGTPFNRFDSALGTGTYGNNGGLSGVFTNVFTFVVNQRGTLSADFSNTASRNNFPSDIDFSGATLVGNGTTATFRKLVGEPLTLTEVWDIIPFDVTPGTYTVTVRGRAFGSIATYAGNFNVAAVPEPATWAMMMIGVGAVGGALRRRKRVSVRFA